MMIPDNYERWHRCITVDCGLELTPSYIDQRIAELSDKAAHRTRRFVEFYGDAHRTRVIGWFERARQEANSHATASSGD